MLVYQRVPFEEVLWNLFKTTSYLQDLLFYTLISEHFWNLSRPLSNIASIPQTHAINRTTSIAMPRWVSPHWDRRIARKASSCVCPRKQSLPGRTCNGLGLVQGLLIFFGGVQSSKKGLLLPISRYKYRDNVSIISIIDRTLQFSWDYNRNRIGIQKGGLWITVAPRFRCSWNYLYNMLQQKMGVLSEIVMRKTTKSYLMAI